MDSIRVACPLCGWWRTLDFGINADGTPREVRFDKVNPATSLLLRVEHLQGHGREQGKSEILLVDAKGILGIDPKFLHQIRTQCHKILDVIEGRTDAKPEPFVPTTPKPVTKSEPKKKEAVKKKKPAAEKKEQPAPKEKPAPREKPPEPESMGVWDTYDERLAAEAARTKAIKRSPEFEWRIQETKGKNYKPEFQLWYFANPEPVKEKPAAVKKPAAKTATKAEPVSEQYSQKEIDDAQSILSQIQTVLNEEKKSATVTKLKKLIEQSNEDMFDGLDDVESAIEEYEGIERSGQTPEEYTDAKSTAFEDIQTEIDSLELAEEVQDIIKKSKKKK